MTSSTRSSNKDLVEAAGNAFQAVQLNIDLKEYTMTRTHASAIALAFATVFAGQAMAAIGDASANQTQAQSSQSSSVSQRVKGDLADWRQAGFDESSLWALSQDVFGKAYQQRYAEYQRLHQLRTQAR